MRNYGAIGALQIIFLSVSVPITFASEPGQLDVSISVAGSAFEGAPQFELRADGSRVGEATLAEPASDEQTFEFVVPDGGSVEQLSVAFTNDHYAVGGGDRNLFVLALSVNGVRFKGSDLIKSEGTFAKTEGAVLHILSNGEAVLRKPEGGWAPIDQTVSDAAPTTPETSSPRPLDDASKTSVDVAVVAAENRPSNSRCVEGEMVITGFAINNSDISPDELKNIKQFLGKTGAGCSFETVGYASMGGTVEVNQRVSEARAKAVAATLLQFGISQDAVTANGAGPTDEFGVAVENRRVVIKAVLDK